MTSHRITGLCSSHPDPDLWFAEEPESEATAKAICSRCPSQNACAIAGKDEPWGVRAGLTPGERLGLMLLATPDPVAHVPSRSCYVTNKCQRPECAEANRRYIAEYRAREIAPVTAGGTVAVATQLDLLEIA